MTSLFDKQPRRILVTGGTGYIGSHTIVELLTWNNDVSVLIVDNLVNSNIIVLERLQRVLTPSQYARLHFVKLDICDEAALENLIVQQTQKIDACIHFAALKAVGESVQLPLLYYSNNLTGTLTLLRVLQRHHITNFIFSSSATVYGMVEKNPIAESFPLAATSPYGQTKLMIEDILRDLCRAPVASTSPAWNVVILRYFNPIGAHPSGLIGEDPNGPPNNLLPFVTQVAVGRREFVSVFGNDYPTADGTGVRDYIHVVDVARGHVAALQHGLFGASSSSAAHSCKTYNLGAGRGYSVLEVISATERACGHAIPVRIVARRQGDVATCYSDTTLANKELHWKTERTLQDAVDDAWRWQSNNPNGYNTN